MRIQQQLNSNRIMGKGPFTFGISSFCVLVIVLSSFQNVLVSGSVRGNDWKDLLLTGSEKFALDEFKSKVIDRLPEEYMKTDFYLIRWLRARNFNLQRAQDMLFENLKWRRDNNIDSILSEDFSDFVEDFPLTFDAHDKMGRPLATLEMGQWDLRRAVLQGKLPRLLRYMDWLQEKLVHRILKAQEDGKNVTRATVLVNSEGINLRQHLCPSCISVFVRMTAGMESHYPGFWEEIIVLNVPPTGRVGVEAIRPVISAQTRQVLKIFDTNKPIWMAYLNERIDSDQRSRDYGGTRPPTNNNY